MTGPVGLAGLMVEDRAWVIDAACLRIPDPAAVFWPPQRMGKGETDYSRAKAVCGRCPVRDACLSWAIKAGEITRDRNGLRSTNGVVWAGVTPRSISRAKAG